MSEFIHLLESNSLLFYGFVFVLSLMIGSFLNVVIYRFPKMLEQGWYQECREFLADELKKSSPKVEVPLTLSKPNSTCPHCQHSIRFYENIPVISWLLLKGKCSQCHNKISARYPIVELSTVHKFYYTILLKF